MHIVYKTENLKTGEFYFGYHTQAAGFLPYEFDGYLGSGIKLNKEIKRTGRDNFTRTTLYYSDNKKECLKFETECILFIKKHEPEKFKRCLNLNSGGAGGWGMINEFRRSGEISVIFSDKSRERISSKGKEAWNSVTRRHTHTKMLKHRHETKRTEYFMEVGNTVLGLLADGWSVSCVNQTTGVSKEILYEIKSKNSFLGIPISKQWEEQISFWGNDTTSKFTPETVMQYIDQNNLSLIRKYVNRAKSSAPSLQNERTGRWLIKFLQKHNIEV